MKLPNPLAVSKQEAYLALLSQVLTDEQEAEIDKPSLEHPDTSFEAWLAFWAGKTSGQYPKDTERDEPLCLSDEEALVAYITGVTDIYPKTPQNPMDIRLSAYLRFLIDERYGRPEGGPVTTSEFYLSLMHPDIMTIPEPSSDFDLNWTTEAPLLDLDVNGDTKQKTLSGKNLFYGEPRTAGGVTGSLGEDGTITITGTANKTDGVGVLANTNLRLQPGASYTFTIDQALPGVVNYTLATSGSNVAFRIPAGSTSVTNVIPSDVTVNDGMLFFGVTNGTVYNTSFKAMLQRSLADINSSSNRTGGTAVVTKQSGGFKLGAGDSNYGYYGILMDKNAISNKKIKPFFGSTVAGAKVKFYYSSTVGGSLTWLFGGQAFASGETVSMPDLSSYAQVYMMFYVGDTNSGTTGQTEITYSDIRVLPEPNDFEPYCGGTASPNPDYPQAVQTVTGRQVVRIGGKNLLDESTMEPGSFNYLTGALFDNNTFIRSQKIPCIPNATYTFSANAAIGEFAVVYYASDGTTVVPGEGHLTSEKSVSYTSPSTAYYMRVKTGGSANPRTISGDYDLQIEEGSTATAFVPYQNAEYEVNLGKNLFDKDSLTSLGTGSYFDGDATSPTIVITPGNYRNETVYFRTPVKGEITLSVKDLLPFSVDDDISQIQLGASSELPASGVSVTPLGSISRYTPTRETITATIPTTANYLLIRMQTNSNVEVADWRQAIFDAIQIEAGSTATPYAPYFDPIELCKLGSGDTVYQDVIFRNNPISEHFDQSLDLDKWYIKKAVKKVVLDGSEEGWRAISNGASGNKRFGYAIIPTFSADPVAILAISDKYVGKNRTDNSRTPNSICVWSNDIDTLLIIATDSTSLTLDQFKSQLASSPVTAYYCGGEPTIEPIEGELANQLDAIMEGGSYDIYTSFKVTSAGENLPALLMVACGVMSDENDLTKWIPTKKNPASWSA